MVSLRECGIAIVSDINGSLILGSIRSQLFEPAD
jgi:hypothetical protein